MAEAARKLAVLEESVESHVVTFASASAEIAGEERRSLELVAREIVELIQLSQSTFQVVRIQVEGHADPSGTPEFNVKLSRDRAQAVLGFLIDRGVPDRLLQPVGKGALMPSATTEGDHRMLRKVSFVVEVSTVGGVREVGR